MASTKGKRAKAAKSSDLSANSRLKKSKVAATVFYFSAVFFVAIIAAASLNIIVNVKEAAAAEFGVGITIPPIKINQTAPAQNMTPSVNGTNISISLPMAYNGTGLLNITINLPSDWKKVVNLRINESGVIKSVTIVGNEMTFESNQSATDVHIIFDAAPPSLTAAPEHLNSTFFQKNLTIESENSFTNASVSIEVNTSFSFYTLYWHNGTDFVDKTVEFNLKVTNGTATFDSFSTSTVLFRLEGALSCTESWSCTGWSDSRQCGTRICTDSNHCGTTNNKPSESLGCPAEAAATGGGGGGGGGGGFARLPASAEEAKKELLAVNMELIRLSLGQGDFKKTSFTVTNTGQKQLRLSIWTEGVSGITTLDTSQIDLLPGASQTIGLLVLVGEEEEPGTYTGKIRISGDGAEAMINVVIEVKPVRSLFDVSITVNPKTKMILPDDSVVAEIAIFNLLGAGRFDVNLLYGVKDDAGNTVTSKQQTVAVETRASFVGIIELPRGSSPGKYSMFAVARLNENIVGVGSDTFEVLSLFQLGSKAPLETNLLFMALMALIALTSLVCLVSVVEIVSHHLPHRHAIATGAGVAGARKGFLGVRLARIWQIRLGQKPSMPSLPAVIKTGKGVVVKQAELKTEKAEKPAAEKEAAARKEEKTEPEKPETPSVSREELDKKLRVLEQSFSAGIVSMKAYLEDKFKIENELKKFRNQ